MMIIQAQNAKCFNCSADAKASWFGQPPETIYVCTECALTVLPRLIADAVAASVIPNERLRSESRNALERVKAAYWEAIASAATDERDPKVLDQQDEEKMRGIDG